MRVIEMVLAVPARCLGYSVCIQREAPGFDGRAVDWDSDAGRFWVWLFGWEVTGGKL